MAFPYTKQTWTDDSSSASAARLGVIEDGIALAGVYGTSSSPPASPVDGMIWRYPVSSSLGSFWFFQYDSSQTTYKWVFMGGADYEIDGNPNAVANSKTQVASTGYWYDASSMSATMARAGDYLVEGWLTVDANGVATSQGSLAVFSGTTCPANNSRHDFQVLVGNSVNGLVCSAKLSAISASTLVGIAFSSGAVGTHKLNVSHLRVKPIRVI